MIDMENTRIEWWWKYDPSRSTGRSTPWAWLTTADGEPIFSHGVTLDDAASVVAYHADDQWQYELVSVSDGAYWDRPERVPQGRVNLLASQFGKPDHAKMVAFARACAAEKDGPTLAATGE
jgi:hypothetical protein